MTKKKRLGRGLDALLSKPTSPAPVGDAGDTPASAKTSDQLRKIPVEQLRRGAYQPRIDMRQDTLEELATAIPA